MSSPKEIQRMLKEAKKASDSSKLDELAKNPNTTVRRVVAKNFHTSRETIERLIIDPCLNVSFVANGHHKNPNRRIIEVDNRCVTCSKDELSYESECQKCNAEDAHKF